MNHGQHGFDAGNTALGVKAVDAEKLARPDPVSGADVVFRATGAGHLLGVHQKGFLLTQSFFGEAALGDIARKQADGGGFFCSPADGGHACLKPAAAGGEINREFDIFADALIDDPAEEFGKGVEDFFAEDFESAAAKEFGAAFAEESFVGSPDA